MTGIIDWSMIAQFRAGLSRLVSGLAAIPAWQAGDCDLPGLERVLEHATA